MPSTMVKAAAAGKAASCPDEAWVVVTRKDEAAVNAAALRANIYALHGEGG